MQSIYEKLQTLDRIDLELVDQYIDQLKSNYPISQDFDNSDDSEDEREFDYPNFIAINDYLWENGIEEQGFFLRHNDLKKMKFAYIFEKLEGLRCSACKCLAADCNCRYICGLYKSTGQVDRFGNFCQYEKCKYHTNDLGDITHECKGVTVDSKVYKFESIDSRSCRLIDIRLCEDFKEFKPFIDNYDANYVYK